MILAWMLLSSLLLPKDMSLYYNGAVIEYAATVNLKRGINVLYLGGIQTKSGIKILEIKSENHVYVTNYSFPDSFPTLDIKAKKLKRRRDSLIQIKEVLDKRIDIIEREENLLLKVITAGKDSIFLYAEQLSKLLDTVRVKSHLLKKKELSLKKKLKDTERELKQVEDSLKLYYGPAIKITALSQKSGVSVLKVRVFNRNISYTPLFTINAEPDKKRAILSAFAGIKNKTGIVFKNVSLSVLMQRYEPSILPDIVPEIYYYDEPEYGYNKYRAKGARKDKTFMSPSPQAEYEPISQIKSYNIGESFHLKGKYTIKDEVSVLVFYDTLKAEFKRRAYPRLYEGVYLFATLRANRYPIYLKNMQVLIDGVYQGHFTYTGKEIVFSDDTFTVNFGRDNMVVVKRKKLKDFSSSSWTGTKTKQFEYVISVENLRHRPVFVEIYDNLPVFTRDEFRLKNIKIKPSGYKLNEETGIIKWSLNLAGKQKVELSLYYEILRR